MAKKTSPSLTLSFFALIIMQCVCVSLRGTHQVNIRQTSVEMRMRTWLNMAECVRWMARCRSFWKKRCKHTYKFQGSAYMHVWHARLLPCFMCHSVSRTNSINTIQNQPQRTSLPAVYLICSTDAIKKTVG